MTPDALRKWRQLGKGPPYITRERRIFYLLSDIEEWYANSRVIPKPPNGATDHPDHEQKTQDAPASTSSEPLPSP